MVTVMVTVMVPVMFMVMITVKISISTGSRTGRLCGVDFYVCVHTLAKEKDWYRDRITEDHLPHFCWCFLCHLQDYNRILGYSDTDYVLESKV
jgi:carbon starvation protein CstA